MAFSAWLRQRCNSVAHFVLWQASVWTLDLLQEDHKWLLCLVHFNNMFLLIKAEFLGLSSCTICASESEISAAVNNYNHSEVVRQWCFKANLMDSTKIDNLCCCSCVFGLTEAPDDSLENHIFYGGWYIIMAVISYTMKYMTCNSVLDLLSWSLKIK